jgi:SpoVK/Ycf46/Vps4 family AAA+-type ATPase
MTDGMTGADIAAIVNTAAMTAIKEHVRQNGGGKLEISMRHFETALEKIKRKSTAGNNSKARDLRNFPVSGSLA